jgi:thymidylate kinase
VIIELFGPPGSGKTTLARALALRLRTKGYMTVLRLSYRPMERTPLCSCGIALGGYHSAVIDRLRRPVAELFAIVRHPLANSRDLATARDLIKLLPPASIFSSLKNSQYLSRLSHSWYEASGLSQVALFDQGFVQAVGSLASVAGISNDSAIRSALDYIPKADLLVRLDTPLDVLEDRLNNRRGDQGSIERLFEHDLKTSLASVEMINRLHDLLVRQGRSVLCVSSRDQGSFNESLNVIERKVVETLEPVYAGVA